MVGLNSLFTKCYRVELFPPYFPLKKSSFTKETNVEKTFQYKIWSQARTQNLSILCLSQEYDFVHLALVNSHVFLFVDIFSFVFVSSGKKS